MRKSDGRILTTHAGSLPRPLALTDCLILQAIGGTVDATEFAALGRAAVADAVSRQAKAGLDIVNDGEQRRPGFYLYVKDRMSGFDGVWDRPIAPGSHRYPEFVQMMREAARNVKSANVRERTPAATGPVAYTGEAAIAAEIEDLRNALAAIPRPFAETFMTSASPGIVALAMHNEYYPSTEDYLTALGRAFRHEYEAIVGAGFALQIDSPDLALERHTTFADRPLSEFLGFAELVVDTINDALANIPRDQVKLHICWGNGEMPHDTDVPLADILPIVLKAKVGALVLPFANGRQAHEFKTFAKMPLPDDMLLVAGVIDTRTNVIEHPEVVADRLERIAQVLGDPTRVIAGTDCGFGTSAGAARVAPDIAWAKLATLSEGARIASDRLFG